MFDDLLGLFLPRGAYIAAGVAIGAAFSKQLRPVAKQMLKGAMGLTQQVQTAAAEAYERGQDLVAEARYEQEQELKTSSNGRPRRARRRTAARTTE